MNLNQKKRYFNIWKYLPTWKEAKWWIITGIIWAIISPPIVTSPSIRESFRISMGFPAMRYLLFMLPILWALGLLSIVWPFPGEEALGSCLFLGIILGGLAGYLLLVVLRPLLKLYSKYYRP